MTREFCANQQGILMSDILDKFPEWLNSLHHVESELCGALRAMA
jgi:hypothetical protein